MVEKELDIDKAKWAIEEFDRQGVVVHGSFMYGFPTETLAEIKKTLSYAIKSPLLHAHFFTVVPQRGTPIYDMAMKENPQATIALDSLDSDSNDYNGVNSWYQLAYGYSLRRLLFVGMLCFYFYPPRMLRLLRMYRMKTFIGLYELLHVIAIKCGLSTPQKKRQASFVDPLPRFGKKSETKKDVSLNETLIPNESFVKHTVE